ncbi:MAG TPA: hypothetical protein VHK46_05880, partial [Gaiellaceae bacterium]|nr:hypothetical protein [Gaiellaceae bacterium]
MPAWVTVTLGVWMAFSVVIALWLGRVLRMSSASDGEQVLPGPQAVPPPVADEARAGVAAPP